MYADSNSPLFTKYKNDSAAEAESAVWLATYKNMPPVQAEANISNPEIIGQTLRLRNYHP